MNPIALAIVSAFIKWVLGRDLFTRVEASVHRWAEKEIETIEGGPSRGTQRRHGVMDELKILGVVAAEWAIRAAIEIAVGKMRQFDTNLSRH